MSKKAIHPDPEFDRQFLQDYIGGLRAFVGVAVQYTDFVSCKTIGDLDSMLLDAVQIYSNVQHSPEQLNEHLIVCLNDENCYRGWDPVCKDDLDRLMKVIYRERFSNVLSYLFWRLFEMPMSASKTLREYFDAEHARWRRKFSAHTDERVINQSRTIYAEMQLIEVDSVHADMVFEPLGLPEL